VTSSGGTQRPTSASEVHQDAPIRVEPTIDGMPSGNGSAPNGPAADQGARSGHASTTAKASTALEVAAALRAQASRAAEATRQAGYRVQDALTTQRDPAIDTVKAPRSVTAGAASARSASTTAAADATPSSASGSPYYSTPTGAAAAIAATAPTRNRDQEAESPLANPTVPPTSPPPSAASVFASPLAAAPAPVVPAPPAAPGPVSRGEGMVEAAETEVSLEARPEQLRTPAPHRGPSTRSTASTRRSTRVRKARLRLLRVDPWSVMKTAFLLSVALGITLFVAVTVLWSVLDAAGVFTAVGDLVRDLTSSETNVGFELENYTALSRVLGFTTLIAVIDVILVTALATLGAFLYNLSASLLGGLELTLAEDD
jgi:hypothetical protein